MTTPRENRPFTICDPLPDLLFRRCKLSQEDTLKLADEIRELAIAFTPAEPVGESDQDALIAWLKSQIVETEHCLEARRQAQATWSEGTSKDFRSVGCDLTKTERNEVAAREGRIAANYVRDLEMLQELLQMVAPPVPFASDEAPAEPMSDEEVASLVALATGRPPPQPAAVSADDSVYDSCGNRLYLSPGNPSQVLADCEGSEFDAEYGDKWLTDQDFQPAAVGESTYDPPPPDMELSEQVRHARGFAAGVCRNDHHTARLLEQMARSIEGLTTALREAEQKIADLAKYDAELTRCTDILAFRWPLASGCNGHLCVAGHLANILDALRSAGERAESGGVAKIAAERRRQIEQEGWTPEHDDEHRAGQMALAAACYATPVLLYRQYERANQVIYDDPWPWEERWDKREFDGNVVLANGSHSTAKRIRQLVKSGALIAAEIDRLERIQPATPGEAEGA